MPMGYAPVFSITPSIDDVKRLNMKTYNTFQTTLVKHNVTLDEFAQEVKQNDNDVEMLFEHEEQSMQEIAKAFEVFQNDFKNTYHVDIYINYHDATDEGSIYDDVDGAFFAFSFEDIYQLTERAEKLSSNLPFNISQFVRFG